MEYFYIHTVSYYIGNNRSNNLISCFNKINTSILSINQNDNDKNLIIFYILYDNLTSEIKDSFDAYKNLENDKTKILILYRFNTGGTVQTLYYTYKYIVNHNISCKYIGVWEDDALFKNNYFLDKVDEYLKKDNIFVGSLWSGTCQNTKYNFEEGHKCFFPPYNHIKRVVPWCKYFNIYNDRQNDSTLLHDSNYKWCEDPYITTIENLKQIEDKLGRFTLAPESERYTHCEHGINYGEVGFPTRLSLNGFKFYGLSKNDHFISLEEMSIGNKNI
jgi:hypothetical protein